jgi:nucleoside-diphosphate-sugar epimerase
LWRPDDASRFPHNSGLPLTDEEKSGMKVLVTGAAGFIGCHVLRHLCALPGIETVALVRASSDLWRLKTYGLDAATRDRLALACADLCDETSIDQVLRQVWPETLIHLAMVYHHLGSAGGPDVVAVNREATLRLHRAFSAHGGRRFVSAGTFFEYGHVDADRIDEAAPCRPCYDYARAKAQATEGLVAQGHETGTETLVLRVFAPYGPMEDHRRIVPQLIAAALMGGRLALSPGEQVRDYVFVEDVAAALVAAALRPALAKAPRVYNVCSGVGHSLRQLAAAVSRVLDRPLDLQWGAIPYRPDEMMRLVGDNRRIGQELGWQPSCSLLEGLRRTAGWMSAHSPRWSQAA